MQRQSFLRGSAVLLIMVFITKSLGLIYKIPLTAMLGGSGMSCYSGAFAVFTPVFALAAAGVPTAVSRVTAEQLALGRYRNVLRYRYAAMLMFSVLPVCLCVMLTLISGIFAENFIHIPEARYAVTAVALTMIPATIMNVRRGWTEGMGSMTPTAKSEICETVVKLMLGLLLPFAVIRYSQRSYELYHGCFGRYCTDADELKRITAPFAAAASALGVAIASAAACLYIFRKTAKLSHELESAPAACTVSLSAAVKRLLKYSVPASLTAVVATLSSTVDLLTIAPSLGRAMQKDPQMLSYLGSFGIPFSERTGFAYGSYTGLALTVFGIMPTFTAMLGKSVLPSLTAACAGGDSAEVRHSIRSVLLLSSAIVMPSAAVMTAMPSQLLQVLFAGSPAECAVAERPLSFLGAGVFFMGVSLPCLTALQACDRQLSAVAITLAGAGVKLLLNMILIPMPQYGVSGAAIATSVSQGVIFAASLAVLIRGTGAKNDCLSVLPLPLLPTALCTLTIITVKTGLQECFKGLGERMTTVFSLAFGSIIYAAFIVILCIMPKNEFFDILSKKNAKNS